MNVSSYANFVIYVSLLVAFSFFKKNKIVDWARVLFHLVGVYFIFFSSLELGWIYTLSLLIYAVIYYLVLVRFNPRGLYIYLPIGLLVLSRVFPQLEMSDISLYFGSLGVRIFAWTGLNLQPAMVGFSYFCFRLMLYGYQYKNENNKASFVQFLEYTFFFPTFYVGPITNVQSMERYNRNFILIEAALKRILWGIVKLYPLSLVVYQLTFSRKLIGANFLDLKDIILGMLSYPVYLYLNFSGITDVIIGFGAILGNRIDENFNKPYLATTVQYFWRRWHISLSELLKNVFYKATVSSLRVKSHLVKYAVGVSVVFTIMGYWHGSSWNFFIFAFLNILALIVERILNFKVVDSEEFKFIDNIHRIRVWVFLAVSFFFFENSPQNINKILTLFFNSLS